ncbi:hypothetical protein HYDPIDRAFT_29490 [Hydnomerulius pinastri MD-312]|uniref:Uncharacterized protein n=1 Tax=Hydnomerulius pinastri MD-312 TaxID=994086 RepID=A0A0C9VY55_9AGAM|nr:hypothetical protein HYDPIDRAFT_29490 [Hydnomerulius pinastri MD-312]
MPSSSARVSPPPSAPTKLKDSTGSQSLRLVSPCQYDTGGPEEQIPLTYDTESSSDVDTEAECEEAILMLEAARVKRKVRQAQKYLADCRLEEHTTFVKLYRRQAETAEKRLEDADMDVGRVRNNIRHRNLPLAFLLTAKLSGPGTTQSMDIVFESLEDVSAVLNVAPVCYVLGALQETLFSMEQFDHTVSVRVFLRHAVRAPVLFILRSIHMTFSDASFDSHMSLAELNENNANAVSS